MKEKEKFFSKYVAAFFLFVYVIGVITLLPLVILTLNEFKSSRFTLTLLVALIVIVFLAERVVSRSSLEEKFNYASNHFDKKFISNTEHSIISIANEVKRLNQTIAEIEFNSSILFRLEAFNKTSDSFNKIINNVVIVHDKFISVDWKENKYLIEKKDNLLKILTPKQNVL